MPGIGVLTATALAAFVGQPGRFPSGRHFARAALLAAHRVREPDALQRWVLGVELRTGHNKATIALANRLAGIAWRVWKDQRPYERRLTPEPSRPGGRPIH